MAKSIWDLFEGHEDADSIRITDVPDGSRIVVVGDMQVPLEDRKLLRTIFDDFAPDFAPKGKKQQYHLFVAGDGMDAFNLSKYLARVTPRFTLGDEVGMMRNYLADWRKAFTHQHYVFGNHEDRWEREIYNGNPQFHFATKSLPEVLELSALGYDWVPYLRHYDFLGFIVTHGDLTRKHVAAGMLDNYHTSGASGHVNRPQLYTWADAANGEAISWHTLGMTCRTDIGDIIKDWRKIQPWQQGFGIGEVHNGVLYFQNVQVHHGSFYANGKVWDIK